MDKLKEIVIAQEEAETKQGGREVYLRWMEEQWGDAEISKEMFEQKTIPYIYLVSNGAEEYDSGIMGLTLCLSREPYCERVRCIFSKKEIPLDFENPSPLLAKILEQDLVVSVLDEDGRLGMYFHSPIQNHIKQSENFFVGIETVGDMSTIRWMEGPSYNTFPAPDNYVPVKVHVSALNFKDVMLACGNLQPEITKLPFPVQSPLGFEFAGVTPDGEKVAGFTDGQAIASSVLANKDWLWKIPQWWSFEDAATFPVAYSTVCFPININIDFNFMLRTYEYLYV